MKILFLGGVFGKENERYIVDNAKRAVEYSANIFQEKLINGFRQNGYDFWVASAPFLGSWPNASKIFRFKNRTPQSSRERYVSFNNIWGIRNLSRATALKKVVKDFLQNTDTEKIIVVYSPHTPFLEAAVYAKSLDPAVKICLIVPDLPQYMNLDKHVSVAYKIGKKIDIARFNQLNKKVDSYVLLTDAMKNKLNVADRPYIIVEGIIDSCGFSTAERQKNVIKRSDSIRHILYTGKLNARFGVNDLVDVFMRFTSPNYRLVLCGKGDAEEYIREKSKIDSRIQYLGQVSPEEAERWRYLADVLVNPRKNDEDYIQYSFPSKTIEYLMTGNPVVSRVLDGMPAIYKEFLCVVENDDLYSAIAIALSSSWKYKKSFEEYARSNLLNDIVARKIIDSIKFTP